ncbi:hypothetical protein [Arcobacter aquimarinus]|uniref:hypothetical protein n=1 Tax=Arcobacter aquimarinus TaxID=1315211 RepID=UPI003BB14247
MKTVILLSLVFSFILTGCSKKEPLIVWKDKYVCIEQKKLDKKEPVQIRIHNDDVNVAVLYATAIDSSLEFYENQVDRNNKFCEEVMK